MRVLDVPLALGARPWAADGEVVLEVADAQGYAAGRYRSSPRRGRQGGRSPTRDAEFALDAETLGTFLVGGGPRDHAAPRGRIPATNRRGPVRRDGRPGERALQPAGFLTARRTLAPWDWSILLVLVVGGYVAWKNRVALMAKVLGQDEARIQRQIERRGKR